MFAIALVSYSLTVTYRTDPTTQDASNPDMHAAVKRNHGIDNDKPCARLSGRQEGVAVESLKA